MLKRLLPPILALSLLLAPRAADAALVEIWGSAIGGFAKGNGQTNRDFFNWAGGGAAGAEVGAKLLFIAVWFDYLRFFGGEASANLASANVGGDGTISLGNLKLVLRAAFTFYFGTLENQTVVRDNITYDSTQIQTRGIGLRGGAGLRYEFGKILSIGVTPLVGWHYFFGGAKDDPLKKAENSSGWDFQALGYLRLGLGF